MAMEPHIHQALMRSRAKRAKEIGKEARGLPAPAQYLPESLFEDSAMFMTKLWPEERVLSLLSSNLSYQALEKYLFNGQLPRGKDETMLLFINCARLEEALSKKAKNDEHLAIFGRGCALLKEYCEGVPNMWQMVLTVSLGENLLFPFFPSHLWGRLYDLVGDLHKLNKFQFNPKVASESLLGILKKGVSSLIEDGECPSFLVIYFLNRTLESLSRGELCHPGAFPAAGVIAEHIYRSQCYNNTSRDTIVGKWGALLHGEDIKISTEVDDSSIRSMYREVLRAIRGWKEAPDDILFSLGYRNACRTGKHHTRLQGNLLERLLRCADKYPSLVPLVIAYEGASPSDTALKGFSERFQKQVDTLPIINSILSSYVAPTKVNTLDTFMEISPHTAIVWGDLSRPAKIDDHLTSWLIAGLPGTPLSVEDGHLILRTADIQDVSRFRHMLEVLANKGYINPVSRINVLIKTPVVGPDHWEDYVLSWRQVDSLLSRKYPSWYTQWGHWEEGSALDYRGLCALGEQKRELVLGNCTLSLTPEFSGGGVLFSWIPMGTSWEFPVIQLLSHLVLSVFRGMIDNRPYVLPSTGLIRAGLPYKVIAQVDKEKQAHGGLIGSHHDSWVGSGSALNFRRHLEGVTGTLSDQWGVVGATGIWDSGRYARYVGSTGSIGSPGNVGVTGSTIYEKIERETNDEGAF